MKAQDHRRLTRKALELFHVYTGSELSAHLLQHSEQVEQGAEDADYHPFTTRITNWHFYPQNNHLQPKVLYVGDLLPLPVTPTSEKILAHRVEELRREFAKDHPARVEELVGRILHHIQDMSTPAHVVPVYHGPRLKDSYEVYSQAHTEAVLEALVFGVGQYNALKAEQLDDILAIYHGAAQATLLMLYDDPEERFYIQLNAEEALGGWRRFWLRYAELDGSCAEPPLEDYPGFGCYGPLGRHFGERSVQVQGDVYEVEPEHYRRLHRRLVNKQIVDSVHTLVAIDTLYRL